MRKSLSLFALAVAALAGSTAANARIVLTLQEAAGTGGSAGNFVCNAATLIDAANCTTAYNLAGLGLGQFTMSLDLQTLRFDGTFKDFSVSTTSFTSNTPGTPNLATLDSSTTSVHSLLANTLNATLAIDIQSYDYLAPAGNAKYVFGSGAYTGGLNFGTGDSLTTIAYVDGTNGNNGTTAVQATNGQTCVMSLIGVGSSCDSGAPSLWNDPNAGTFGMRTTQIFRLTGGASLNTVSHNEVTRVPEPASLMLVGAALVGLGAAARRKAKKA